MSNYDLENFSNSKEAITCVVVFFDLFDYPPTAYEVYEYLDKKYPLPEIITALTACAQLEIKNGFYFLRGRSEIIAIRQKKHNYSQRKIKIARRFSRLLCCLPFIKVIALSNSIGQFNLRDASDIDFFIISSPRRLWLTRLICATLAKILNKRPTPKNKKDKICLSFYITRENLNLDNLQLKAGDPYFFFWLRSLILLYNKEGVYEEFLEANRLAPLKMKPLTATPNNFILNFLERLAKNFQFIIMSSALKQAMNNSVGVFVSDKVLKLYLRDKRQEYAEKYGNKLRQIFTENN